MDRQYNSQQKAVIELSVHQLRLSVGCCIVCPSITAFCWLLYCLSINYGFLLAVVLSVHQLRLSEKAVIDGQTIQQPTESRN
jgi:hypothetical protein